MFNVYWILFLGEGGFWLAEDGLPRGFKHGPPGVNPAHGHNIDWLIKIMALR